ncbi:MAG TPA: hypothetical protein VIV60_18770 [Polyangiaceae bacterium]
MIPESSSLSSFEGTLERMLGGDARYQRIAAWELKWMGVLAVGLVAYLLWATTSRRSRRPKPNEPRAAAVVPRRVPMLWLGALPCFLGLLVVDAWAYCDRLVAPLDSVVINALAREGGWEFTYPNGRISNRTLVVPRDRPVRLVLTSLRGIRRMSMVEPRVSATALAGRFTTTWFKPERLGEYPIVSADGPEMKSDNSVHVMQAQEFDAWMSAPR